MEYENADKQLQEKRQELESTSDAQRKEQLQKDINNLENYQQNQKSTYRIGKNIFKFYRYNSFYCTSQI